MDVTPQNLIGPIAGSASNTVAHALSSRRAVQATPKDATATTTGSSSSSATVRQTLRRAIFNIARK